MKNRGSTRSLDLTPAFSADGAAKLLAELYGKTGRLETLPSESDQNFRVDTDVGEHFVLKIANAGETASLLECQNHAMAHVGQRLSADACPQVATATDGASITTALDVQGRSHPVRLLTYLHGDVLANVKPHDAELLSSVGMLLGSIDCALHDFHHPSVDRDIQWDLRQAERVILDDLGCLSVAEQSCISRFVDGFHRRRTFRLDNFRTAIIHNDANDYNVVAGPRDRWAFKATGLIDFGDLTRSYLVAEPAIAAAYAMLGKRDPLAAAAHVVAGYHSVMPLLAEELGVIFDLMCMRLCASACIAARQTTEAPANAYLRISQGPVWDLLRRLESVPPALAHYRIRDACGLSPCPRSKQVASWVQDRRSSLSPIVDGTRPPSSIDMLDLSITGSIAQARSDISDPGPGAPTSFDHIGSTGGKTPIGRYDEVRLCYGTAQFSACTDELPERRTVHLGVDVFLPPGSDVRAPLAARIHSFADNESPGDYGPTLILEHDMDGVGTFFTLYGHLSRKSLKHLEVGATVRAGERIGEIGHRSENGGWPPHVHVQLITDMLGLMGNFPGVAAPSLRRVWTGICPDPSEMLGMDEAAAAAPRAPRATSLMKARRQHLGRSLSVAYRRPLHIVRGAAQFLFDEQGRGYLDCVNNVAHVGHSHPRVVGAGQAQMAVLNTNTRYLHESLVNYAERLLALFPSSLEVVHFVCSGSEANELALRMAHNCAGRHDTIVLSGAYHGNTRTLIDISPYKHCGPGGDGAPSWVHSADMPDRYRGRYRGHSGEVGRRYAEQIALILEGLAADGQGPAATFIAESAMGCGGQIILPDGYLRAAYDAVRGSGGICIADEVQVGFGRAGSHFWMFETQSVVPDIVTLGKPMGNGHPLGAVVTTRAIADAFANGMEYFNTFGGNPVSCAIGNAVLDVIDDEDLQARAATVGTHFCKGLHELKKDHSLIGDVRGRGLFIGVEFVTDHLTRTPATAHAARAVERLRDHGILSSTDGPAGNVVKFKPPMAFTRADADRVVCTLDSVLAENRLREV